MSEKNVEAALESLNTIVGVTGSLVAGKEGSIISHKTPEGTDIDLASAMASTLFGTGEKAVKDFKQGNITQAMVEGKKGKTLIIAGDKTVLMVMTDLKVSLGLVRLEMGKSIKTIEKAL